jgi:predicted aldo/keto reductase-like oxidoreductase
VTRKVKKVRFGKSGLMVTEVAFGGIPIMRLTKDEAVQVVRDIIDLGVNFIDTANAYADSEEKIGSAIKGMKREDLVLASKSTALDKKTFNEHLDNSLKQLGVDYLDLYQHHNISDAGQRDKIFAPGGAFEGMMEAVNDGRVHFPAFSSHNVPIAVELMKTEKFFSVQLPYNFIDSQCEQEAIPLARQLDMGFIAMKPMGGGMIGDARIAFRFLTQQNGIIPDPGIEKTAEMKEIIEIVNEKNPLSHADIAKIEEYRAELGATWCHRCDYCQPCPQKIKISAVLGARSIYKRMPKDRAKQMLGGAVAAAKTCIECGDCMTRCPYNLKIPELLKKAIEWCDNVA